MAEKYISNKMTSAYSLVAVDESYIEVEVIVGRYVDEDIEVEVTPRVIGNSEQIVEFDVKYAGDSEIEVDVQPYIHNEIEVEVEVHPHNSMTALYELKEAPTEIVTEYPVQDSYVVAMPPYSSVNFGSNNSMIVGNDANGENISLIIFDLSSTKHTMRVKNAKARFYYSRISEDMQIETYNVGESWSELGVTYLNKPEDFALITNEYTHNEVERYIEIDLTETVQGWILGLPNNGISLHSDYEGTSIFRTRQTSMPPQLFVEYFTEFPPTPAISQIDVEVTCKQSDVSEIEVDLEVISTFTEETIEVEVEAHNTNDIILNEREVIVYVSRPEIEVEVDAYRQDASEIEVEVTRVTDSLEEIEVEVEVPIHDGESEIEAEITVVVVTSTEIEVEVEVPLLDGDSDREVEVTCVQKDESSIEVEVESTRNYKVDNSEIMVEVDAFGIYKPDESLIEVEVDCYKDYKDSQSEIEVYVGVPTFDGSEVEVEVYVSRPEIEVEVVVPYVGDSEIEVDVRARVFYVDDIEVEVTVGGNVVQSETYIYLL